MGSLYKRTYKTSDGEIRERPTWWLKYHQNGRAIRESTGTTKETVAKRMLRLREGDVERGIPVNPRMDRLTFKETAQDVIHDYETNGKKSLRVLRQRINHLRPFFGEGRRMAGVRVSDIRAYIVHRQRSYIVTGMGDHQRKRQPSNGQINRELTTLKRMSSLAVQSKKLARKPHIPLLAEAPARFLVLRAGTAGRGVSASPLPITAVVRFRPPHRVAGQLGGPSPSMGQRRLDRREHPPGGRYDEERRAPRIPVHRRTSGPPARAMGRARGTETLGHDLPVRVPSGR